MKFARLLFYVSLLATTSPLWALYSTMDTGDLLERGEYQAQFESQIITHKGSGVNWVGRFDSPLHRDANVRALLGFGETNFQLGGFIKWMPIPDFQTQPAIGLLAGVLYARDDHIEELSLRIHPLVSKRFRAEPGDFTPYISLPIGLRTKDNKSQIPVQLTLGSDFRPYQFDNISFRAEVGLDITKAFSYISLGAVIRFDEEHGLQFTSL